MLQVNVAVEQAKQFPGTQAGVQHEDVGRWLLVFRLAVTEFTERLSLEFLYFLWREHCDRFQLCKKSR